MAATTSLSRGPTNAPPDRLFGNAVLEIYRDVPGGSSVIWAPLPDSSADLDELQQTLGNLPLLLVTVVKRSCSFKDIPVSSRFLVRRNGCSLLISFIAKFRHIMARLNRHTVVCRCVEAQDEVNFTLKFPDSNFEHCLHRGFGHALDTLENDLCELREMLQNEKPAKSDVTPLVYECKRILRKANLLRWVVCVFLYTCVPLLNGQWLRAAGDCDDLKTAVDQSLLQGTRQLQLLGSLPEQFWHHPQVLSVLEKVRLR